ncbi:MAG TPA: hypothetical protein VMG74_08730 [Gaiellaceae bacterium]|nr:hypothetical protein [Gaiellaceae bacterium]
MPTRRSLAALPALLLSGAVLVVGSAAAPRKDERAERRPGLRLIAKPRKLAPAVKLAPGDRVERRVELSKRGPGRFAAIYFVARARTSSTLDADRLNGLHVTLRRCKKKWRRRGAGYRCAHSVTLVTTRPLIGRRRLRLSELRLRGARRAHLLLVISLPATAGTALAGQRTSVTYSFVGVPRGRRRLQHRP